MMSPSGAPSASNSVSFWPHPIAAVAFFIGAALAASLLKSMFEWHVVAFAAAVCTVVWLATGLTASGSPPLRWLGRAAWIALLSFYALCAYLAVVFGMLLAWTVPTWGWALTAAAAIAAIGTVRRSRKRLHVPVLLPVGIWIAVVLSGWLREEMLLRCDDLDALRPPAQLVVPNSQLASCRPGEVRPSGRFPRTIWQDPDDGERVVFTTQGEPVPGGLDGSVCEARLGADTPPICIGRPFNKSQGLIDVPEENRLLAMQWGVPTPSGNPGAVLFELPRDRSIAVLGEHWFDEPFAEGFYEPRNSTLYMFSDRMDAIHPAVLPDFELMPPIPVEFTPGEVRYDPTLGEGVACGGGIGAAIRGDPFSFRYFLDGDSSLIDRLSLTWGCDWDAASHKVYSTVPNLALLDLIDYDTGRVEKRWFVGPGMRSVAYDRSRRRVYIGDFLRGYVLAFDETSERVVARWFVGRFSRWVRLTRDGRALLATGNLGIVRIPLNG